MKTGKLVAVLIAGSVALSALATPASAGKRDRRKPGVNFTTAENATVSQATPVEGEAWDRRSGIKKVIVTFCAGSKGSDGSWTCDSLPSSTRAELDCHEGRKHCLWSASPPLRPGSHLVFVKAVDRAGNKTYRGPRQVTVI